MALTSFEAAILATRTEFRNAVRIHLLKAAMAIAADPQNASNAYALKVLRGEYDIEEWSFAIASSHLVMGDADVTLDDGETFGITTEIQSAIEGHFPVFAAANAS